MATLVVGARAADVLCDSAISSAMPFVGEVGGNEVGGGAAATAASDSP